jgi:hypothetical protein
VPGPTTPASKPAATSAPSRTPRPLRPRTFTITTPVSLARWRSLPRPPIGGPTPSHASPPPCSPPRDWPSLAHAIDRAHAAGYDIAKHLPRLATQHPLSTAHPARDLRYRLIHPAPAAAADATEATRHAHLAAIDQDAHRRLVDHNRRGESSEQARTDQDTSPHQERPEDRWRTLIRAIDAGILADEGWTALAVTLDHAAATGLNVADELPRLAIADGQLPPRHAAAELRYRVLNRVNLNPSPPDPADPNPQHRQTTQPPQPPRRPQRDRPAPPRP